MANIAMDNRGGGQLLPGYLEGRTAATKGPFKTMAMTPQPNQSVNPLQKSYDAAKQSLQDQAKKNKTGAIADASARGVYYGTPLTTSLGDIDSESLKALGQLQGQYGALENQNQLARLSGAAGLLNSAPQPQVQGIDPQVFQALGSLYGTPPSMSGMSNAVAGQRPGPARPMQNPIYKNQPRNPGMS